MCLGAFLKSTILAFTSSSLQIIFPDKWKQQNAFDGRHSHLAFNNPDFDHLAKAFGIWGKSISSAGELKPAIEESFRQDGPALIAVPVNYGENTKLTRRLGNLNFSI